MRILNRNSIPSAKRSEGFILAVVLVVLTLLTGFAVVWTQRVLLLHRESQARTFSVQADWLAESALQKALAQFAQDDDYEGETWQLLTEELQGSNSAKIEIKVTPGEQQNSRVIAILVDYPEDPALRQRVRLQQHLLLSQTENETSE